MQITLNETEILSALDTYVRSQISISLSQNVSIELKAGRGENGFSATLDIVPAVLSAAPTKPVYRGSIAGNTHPDTDAPETKPIPTTVASTKPKAVETAKASPFKPKPKVVETVTEEEVKPEEPEELSNMDQTEDQPSADDIGTDYEGDGQDDGPPMNETITAEQVEQTEAPEPAAPKAEPKAVVNKGSIFSKAKAS